MKPTETADSFSRRHEDREGTGRCSVQSLFVRFVSLRAFVMIVAVTGAVAVHASGPIAVYARVDKVVIEPNADAAPGTVQIWGVFSVAKPKNANDFLPASRGYLYYALPSMPGYRQVALQEWNDLKAVAGTNQIVAFGSQLYGTPTVRKGDERPQSPDEYSLNFGIRKISGQTGHAPVRAILDFKP